jgi:hypothetical protein
MPVKFSEFVEGGVLKVGDKTVGLRNGVNTQFEDPSDGFKDEYGNYLLKYETTATTGPNGANYPLLISKEIGLDDPLVQYTAEGPEEDISLHIMPKGNGDVLLGNGGLIYINESVGVDEVSSDAELSDASNTMLSTTLAVKTYIDASIDNIKIDNSTIIKSTEDEYELVNTFPSPIAIGLQRLCEFVYDDVQYVVVANFQQNTLLLFYFYENVMYLKTSIACANAVGCCAWLDTATQYIAVTQQNSNTISVFTFNGSILTLLQTFASAGSPQAICTFLDDNDDRCLAVTGTSSADIKTFRFVTGSFVSFGTPVATGTSPYDITSFYDGSGVLWFSVTNAGANTFSSYTLVSNLLVSNGAAVATGVVPRSISSFEYNGEYFVVIVNVTSNTFSCFKLTAGTFVSTGAATSTGATAASGGLVSYEKSGEIIVSVGGVNPGVIVSFLFDGVNTFTQIGSPVTVTSLTNGNVGTIISFDYLDSIYVVSSNFNANTLTTIQFVEAGSFEVGMLGVQQGAVGFRSYTLGDTLYASASNLLAKLSGNITTAKQFLSQTGTGSISAAPAWATITGSDITGAALTKIDDTNVTLTLGGTPSTALLRSASLTLGWTGLLGLQRGGVNADLSATGGVSQVLMQENVGNPITVRQLSTSDLTNQQALTKIDDTNVTLTLGGSPSTALLNATSLTLGWNGLLGLSRGGLNANLSATGGANQVLMQSSVGAAITVSQLSANNLSNGTTGTGAIVLADSPTFTTQITTPTVVRTGATDSNTKFTANSGTAITISPSDGPYQQITLTGIANITLSAVPSSTLERQIILDLVQDATANRTVTWTNITFATNSGAPPVLGSSAGQKTTITIIGTSEGWTGYCYNGLGMISGATPTTGSIGETLTASIAEGSAVSLTTATATVVTSINYTAGNWMVYANPTFIGSGITATELQSFLSTASGTSTTGQDTFNTSYGTPFIVGASARESTIIAGYPFKPTSSGTLYLKAKATFSVGSCTAFGGLIMVRGS